MSYKSVDIRLYDHVFEVNGQWDSEVPEFEIEEIITFNTDQNKSMDITNMLHDCAQLTYIQLNDMAVDECQESEVDEATAKNY